MVFIALGSWQLIRLNWKNNLILEIEDSLKNLPTELDKSNVKNYLIGYEGIRKHIYEEQGKDLDFKLFKNGSKYFAEIYTIGIPRHPAQMYEAFYCLLLFISLLSLWYFRRSSLNDGFIFSIFMIVLWTLRIVDELLKENQVDWESDIPLNMGQWLSIPMIILGLIIFFKTYPRSKTTN